MGCDFFAYNWKCAASASLLTVCFEMVTDLIQNIKVGVGFGIGRAHTKGVMQPHAS